MKTMRICCPLILCALMPHAALFAESDFTPPVLAGFSFSPTTINPEDPDQAITFTARITDDLAGVGDAGGTTYPMGGASATFYSPSMKQSGYVDFSAQNRASGDARDGVYTTRLVLPMYSEPGVWMLMGFSLTDDLGNNRQMDLAECLRLGLPVQFTVRGTGDTNAPQVVSLVFSPARVDTSSTNNTITFAARLTDDLSGVGTRYEPLGLSYNAGYVSFVSPSKKQRLSGAITAIASGDALDGVWTNTLTLSQFSEPGTWVLDTLFVQDAAGNSLRMDLAACLRANFPAEFTVQGTGDTNPPQPASFAFSPVVVDTSTTSQTILLTARLTDDLSGIGGLGPGGFRAGGAQAWFWSPSGKTTLGFSFDGSNRLSGDDTSGVYTNSLIVPRSSEAGIWTLGGFVVSDVAGNQKRLELAECLRLGFPTRFTVAGTGETTPAQIVGIQVAPEEVDTSNSNQTLRVTVRLTNDFARFVASSSEDPNAAAAMARFVSPSAKQVITASFNAVHRISGDEQEGAYASAARLPRFSEPGVWTLASFALMKSGKTLQTLDLAAFLRLNMVPQFTVQGTGDTTLPQLASLSLSPTTVDTSLSSQSITVTARLTDDLSGMGVSGPGYSPRAGASATFYSPTKLQSASVSLNWTNRVSGDALDGVYSGPVILPRFSEPGVWTLDRFEILDGVGNPSYLTGSDLFRSRFPSQFIVQGIGDTNAPNLASLSFSPAVVDTSRSSQVVTIRVRLSDDLSGIMPYGAAYPGFATVSAQLSSPTRKQTVSLNWLYRLSGDLWDGVYEGDVTLPRFSESGIWSLDLFIPTDAAGNSARMNLANLVRAGLPTQLLVNSEPTLTIHREGDSLWLSWPVMDVSYILQSADTLNANALWTNLSTQPMVVGTENILVVPVTNQPRFYRVRNEPGAPAR